MEYKAKWTVHYGSRFICKGGKVPDNYPRLREGIKGGWIVKVGGSAAISPKPVATKVVEPEVYQEPTIANLEYLNPAAKDSLSNRGLTRVGDLKGWSIEELDELKGIGPKLAAQLAADCQAHVGRIGLDEPPVEHLPAEEEPVTYEESRDEAEDEGDQDDPL